MHQFHDSIIGSIPAAMPSVYHDKALGRRRHARRLLPIEHNRPYASVAEGERNDLGDEPSSGPGSVAPPAVRPRAHDVVAVHEDSGFRCLGHAVLRSPSCRRGCPETERRPLPCQGQGAMILGAWGRDTMAMRIPGSYCADGADCDSAGIRRSPRTGIYSRLFGRRMAPGCHSGAPCRARDSSSTSVRKLACSVFDSRHVRIYRLAQPMIEAR